MQRPGPGMEYQPHPAHAGMMPSPNLSHHSHRNEHDMSHRSYNSRASVRSNGIPVMECKYSCLAYIVRSHGLYILLGVMGCIYC